MAETTRIDERETIVRAGDLALSAYLTVPRGARGLVIFAHGSGSGRHSPRNQFVARELNEGGLATLLLDLLTPEEEAIDARTAELRFDIALLTERVAGAVDWARESEATRSLDTGLFGSSTGAAAALAAAARRPHDVHAVVSRGGRPDLALDSLPEVCAPSLLIVGGEDVPVLEMNREAARYLRTEQRLEVVPGASHLFEEPGTLEQVAALAREWFARHLGRTRGRPGDRGDAP